MESRKQVPPGHQGSTACWSVLLVLDEVCFGSECRVSDKLLKVGMESVCSWIEQCMRKVCRF